MRRIVVIVVFAALLSAGQAAFAFWRVTGDGGGTARAQSAPAGAQPSATAAGRTVTVTWQRGSFSPGPDVAGYRVRRFDAGSGAQQTILSNCAGRIEALTCTEHDVPPGTWRYAVATVHAGWTGDDGPRSTTVTVAAPSLRLDQTQVSALPATLSGSIDGFVPGETVTFRLDAPTGAAMSGATTPSSVPSSGAATVSLTLPAGTAEGPHTVYAVGSGGTDASAAVAVAIAPRPTSLTIVNGGSTAGKPEKGDVVTVEWSERLKVSSVCSAWSGNDATQTLRGNSTRVTIRDGGSGHDRLELSDPSCNGGLAFGTLTLGSAGFVSGDVAFEGPAFADRSEIAWNPGTRRLSITLGKTTGTTATIGTSVTATYAPSASIKDLQDLSPTGTGSATGTIF